MTVLWRQPDGLVLRETHKPWRFVPDAGSERFHQTLERIRAQGIHRALTSFTFDEDAAGSIAAAAVPGALPKEPAHALGVGRLLDHGIEQWSVAFEDAMKAIDHDDLQKVVISRRVVAGFSEPPDPLQVAAALIEAHPNSYVFGIDGFIGASPELLVELNGDRLRTQTLAGTAANEPGLDTEKQRTEHAFAAASVRDALAGLTVERPHESASIVEQRNLTHLATMFEGRVRPGVTIADCLSALHPTAAVAGTPTPVAMRHIASSEPPRGRYAGPVGWMNQDGEGVYALALRCAQIEGRTATLFAGGGLVSKSSEQAELEETNLKLNPMLEALGLTLN